MSLLIGDNSVVRMHYTLTNSDGEVLDSSSGGEPLAYLHGAGNIIPGLERELTGKVTGDSLTVVVAPEDGYGEVHEELFQVVPREAFQGIDTIEPGMNFQAQGEGGQVQSIVVAKVDGDQITVDANHPLAGVQLHFDVEIVEVRDASAAEIAQGHIQ